MSPLADLDRLVVEGRYGRADVALRRIEALIPSLAQSADEQTLLLALYGRAVLLRQLGASTQNAIGACDVLERAAHERQATLWAATACALRARFRVDAGDIGGATADLARADAELATEDLSSTTGYRLLDGVALVYAGLRLNDRADEVRARIESSIASRRVLERAQHWAGWAGELASRAMEPLAGGAPEPQHELMARAVQIAAKLDDLPEAEVPATLRRGARGVRALSAAYRGRPSEALRLLGPDAFGTVGDLPTVERQIVSLAAMRAHALVGSLATARSLDDAAATPPATLANLVLEVCRTRERLWLETYAGGDVIPVLHRMTELLVRLGWRGMDLVADTARQALEHQALRTESRTDALTGVGNRRALDEELRQLLRFGPLPLALILVDIDHFKEVNDRFTHVVGDEVLRRVAASLSLQLRTDDQLLRYGGDEFVVLLPGTGDEEANAVAERMVAAVAARPWNELADGLSATVTTGVAAVWSLSGRRPDADAEKLFRRADERLLDAKRDRPEEAGRDRSRGGPTLLAPGPIALAAPVPSGTRAPKARAGRPEGVDRRPDPLTDPAPAAVPVAEVPVAAVAARAGRGSSSALEQTGAIDLRSSSGGVSRLRAHRSTEPEQPAARIVLPPQSPVPHRADGRHGSGDGPREGIDPAGSPRRAPRRGPSPFDPVPTRVLDLAAPVNRPAPTPAPAPEPAPAPAPAHAAAAQHAAAGYSVRTRRQALDASGAMKLPTATPQRPAPPEPSWQPAPQQDRAWQAAQPQAVAPEPDAAAPEAFSPLARRDLDPPSVYGPGGYEPPRYESAPPIYATPDQAPWGPDSPWESGSAFEPAVPPAPAAPADPAPPAAPAAPPAPPAAERAWWSDEPAEQPEPDTAATTIIPATTSPSGWRDPSGPPTTRQAIIDLSARKRPRPRA